MKWILKLVSRLGELALLTAACLAAGDWASAAEVPHLLQPGVVQVDDRHRARERIEVLRRGALHLGTVSRCTTGPASSAASPAVRG